MNSKTLLNMTIFTMTAALVACGKPSDGGSQLTRPAQSEAVGGGDSSGGDVPRLDTADVRKEILHLKSDLRHAFRRLYYFAKPELDEINSSISIEVLLAKIESLEIQPIETPCEENGVTRDASYDHQGRICLSMPRIRELPKSNFKQQLLALGAHEVAHALGGNELQARSLQALVIAEPQIFANNEDSATSTVLYYSSRVQMAINVLSAAAANEPTYLCRMTAVANNSGDLGRKYSSMLELPKTDEQGYKAEMYAEMYLVNSSQFCSAKKLTEPDQKELIQKMMSTISTYQGRINQIIDLAFEKPWLEKARFYANPELVQWGQMILSNRNRDDEPIKKGENVQLLNQTVCTLGLAGTNNFETVNLKPFKASGRDYDNYGATVVIKDVDGKDSNLRIEVDPPWYAGMTIKVFPENKKQLLVAKSMVDLAQFGSNFDFFDMGLKGLITPKVRHQSATFVIGSTSVTELKNSNQHVYTIDCSPKK